MGKRENSLSSASSSNRRQWERIFKNLVEMLQSQQSQLETLADDRKFLEQYALLQHDHWTSRIRFLESHIAQLKKEEAKGRKIQVAKADLMLDVKQREALCYKKQYELAEADLEDFHACLEALSAELLELKGQQKRREAGRGSSGVEDSSHMENSKESEQCTSDLKGEIRKLKHSYKALSLKKEAEVSALLAEKDFVWHQLKKMENDYIAIVKNKKIEVEHANEAVGKLQHDLQALQVSVNDKDEMIAELKARHELDMRRYSEEAEQANEKINRLQLDKEETCLLAREKDETITRLKKELAELEMKVPSCTNGKSRFSKECSAEATKTTSGSNPKKVSRRQRSEGVNKVTKQNNRHGYDNSSGSRASAPPQGLVRCATKRRTRSDHSVERSALFNSGFKSTTSSTFLTFLPA